MPFGGNFYLGLLKIILQSFLFYMKKLLKIIFLCPFFEVKNQNEPIAIKIHTHKILLMQLNLLLAIRYRKMGWKSNINIHLSKQILLFCPLLLGMWKNVLTFFRMLLLLYSIYVVNFYQYYFWMLQFTDKFSSLNHLQEYWKEKNMIYLLPYHEILSFWIEYGKKYQLSFFLYNLRWHHNRFQTLRRYFKVNYNFLTLLHSCQFSDLYHM